MSPCRELRIVIPGEPVAKGRPRFTKDGKTYTPKKTKNWEAHARWCAFSAMRHQEQFLGPIEVHIVASFVIPRSWPVWKRQAASRIGHTSAPDHDNLEKNCCDAFQGIVFKNDSYIVTGSISKRWCTGLQQPGVAVTIKSTELISSQAAKRKDFL